MISREQQADGSGLSALYITRVEGLAPPFPVFTDATPDGKRGFVQFWPERDCAPSIEFLRAIDPATHARWWTQDVFSRVGARDQHPAGFILPIEVEGAISHPALKKRVLAALGVVPEPGHLAPVTGGVEYASSESLNEPLGESRELLPEPPELYDPEIYFEHTPTQSPFASAERQRAEGEQDAGCVRRYLTAYKRFMEVPSVGRLLDATQDPQFGDSYYLAMKWCLKNKVSEDFISLLHVTFAVQWVLQSRPYGSTPSPTGSRGLFREDVELLAGVVRRYCQGEERAERPE